MDEQITESSADAPAVPEASPERPPAHLAASAEPDAPRRRRRWPVVVVLVPLVLFLLAVVAWAVDSSSGGVARNVTVAGEDVSGLSESALRARLEDIAARFADTPVELVVGDDTYRTDAGTIGIALNEDRTAKAVLDVDGDTFVLFRPVVWMRSFFDQREAPVSYRVNGEKVETTLVALEGDARVAPTEPGLEVVDGAFRVVPGEDGVGLDPEAVTDALPAAAEAVELGRTIRLELSRTPIAPLVSDATAEAAIARAEALVANPLEVVTSAGNRTLDPEVMKGFVRLSSQPDGTATLVLDPMAVAPALRSAFADVPGHPVDARITLDGGQPVVVPDQPGLVCCGDDATNRVLTALQAGQGSVELELVQGAASFTTADAQAYQITTAVGGNHAWRNGSPTTAGPGFTTYHAPTGSRIINIHRMADQVRGAVVPPGGSFSINAYVGQRTKEKGYVPAGAISNGQHVDEVGGGVSQFATTMFNAAYFAGLDIDEYQAHSEYFDRYPRGREATMGYPAPDLKWTNNTPYGILIWTSYTQSSLTVTLYSTPFATAEQTGITESMSGRCKVVVTTRTRTFPDGHREDDTFRARYRPGEGQSC